MKYKEVLNRKKGVAGLEILLSLIAMLFMIGIIVMVFVIAGARLQESVSGGDFLDGLTTTNETEAFANTTGYTVTNAGLREAQSFAVTDLWNATTKGKGYYNLSLANNKVSISATGILTNATNTEYINLSVSYTLEYLKDATAVKSINDTYQSISDVTDWFPTFIVLGALVVLILLVVIIITAIKRSRITEGA